MKKEICQYLQPHLNGSPPRRTQRHPGKKALIARSSRRLGPARFFSQKIKKHLPGDRLVYPPNSGRPLFGFPFRAASVRVFDRSGRNTPGPLASRAIGLILFSTQNSNLMSKLVRKTNLWSFIHVPKTIIACGARFAPRGLQNNIHE
ncbi:hypothetical protein ACR42D_11565 [Desulfovibrio caledoniensis]